MKFYHIADFGDLERGVHTGVITAMYIFAKAGRQSV